MARKYRQVAPNKRPVDIGDTMIIARNAEEWDMGWMSSYGGEDKFIGSKCKIVNIFPEKGNCVVDIIAGDRRGHWYMSLASLEHDSEDICLS